jgi:Right handed beta helix region
MQKHRPTTNVIAGALIALTLTVTAQAQNSRSFVATTGNDANTCSATAYCRTFGRALSVTNSGGELVVVNSGGYGGAVISQPVVITAIGIDASITAISGNAFTINTTGNVTISGLNISGGGSGNDGIDVTQVGFLRLYNMQIQNFANNGIEFTSSGNLAIYDSKITDSAAYGLLLNNPGAQAYVHNSAFDNNTLAGAIALAGNMTIAESSAHFNGIGFWAYGGSLALMSDRAIFNTVGVQAGFGGAPPNSAPLYFTDCLLSNNGTAYLISTGGAITGSNPGTTLITPGQTTSGSLGTATTLN